MSHYKNPVTGQVFFYDTAAERDEFGEPELVEMSDTEVADYLAKNTTAFDPLAQRRAEARAYLVETDWYLVRRLETGAEVPEAVLAKRAEARAILS